MEPLDLLLVHAAATWALVGLIWVVQLVQYPGFALVGASELGPFHAHHSARITWIVAPLMAAELASGVALVPLRPEGVSPTLVWTGLLLIGVNWLCTAFVSVPLHGRLGRRTPRVQRTLVTTNWIRTAAWSARGGLVLIALRGALAA